jgi:hypothetical protein
MTSVIFMSFIDFIVLWNLPNIILDVLSQLAYFGEQKHAIFQASRLSSLL